MIPLLLFGTRVLDCAWDIYKEALNTGTVAAFDAAARKIDGISHFLWFLDAMDFKTGNDLARLEYWLHRMSTDKAFRAHVLREWKRIRNAAATRDNSPK